MIHRKSHKRPMNGHILMFCHFLTCSLIHMSSSDPCVKNRNTMKYLRPPNTNHQCIVSIETVGLHLANTTTFSRTRLNIPSNNPNRQPNSPAMISTDSPKPVHEILISTNPTSNAAAYHLKLTHNPNHFKLKPTPKPNADTHYDSTPL